MKPLLLLLFTVVFSCSQAQTETDTTTYELTLSDGRMKLVKFLDMQNGHYIKVVDEEQKQYTYSWDAFRYYKPAYQKKEIKPVEDKRFSPNYNHSGYVARVPGKRQRNVGIGLFALGAGFLVAALPMIFMADNYSYHYYWASNGQPAYSRGDLKGPLGVTMAIHGVALSITGAALWGTGNRKMKRFAKSKEAIH
jgi:hypothetical protein